MAFDKSSIRVDLGSANANTGEIKSLNIRSDVTNGLWVMIYNKSATDTLNIWPREKGGNPITIASGTKRVLGYFTENFQMYARSSGVSAIDYEVWSNPNKWGSEWQGDEQQQMTTTPVTGVTLSIPGDPPQVSTVPYTYDFLATMGRYASYVTFYCNTLEVEVALKLKDDTSVDVFRVEAGRGFTVGDGAEPIDIHTITITPIGVGAWALNLWGY